MPYSYCLSGDCPALDHRGHAGESASDHIARHAREQPASVLTEPSLQSAKAVTEIAWRGRWAAGARAKLIGLGVIAVVLLMRVEPDEAELMLGAMADVLIAGTADRVRRLASDAGIA